MNSVKSSRAAGIALACFLAAALPAQAATVVAAGGPSAAKFKLGSKLANGAQLALVQGDVVTLLDEKGTRRLNGPGTFTVGQASSETRKSVFAALVQDRASVRVRTGSVRAGPNGEPPRAPNLWYVDVSRPGTYCVTDLSAVRLWRPTMGAEMAITVKSGATGAPVAFGKDDMVAPWSNAAVPVKTGAAYELAAPDGRPMGSFDFKLVKGQQQSIEDMAALLIGEGCTQQLDLLSSSLMLPEG